MANMEVKKRVPNAILYTNGMIKIENVRLSYPHLDRPYVGKGDDGKQQTPKYGVVGMLPKKTHVEAKNLIVEAMNEMLKVNDNATVSSDKRFCRNGDDHEKSDTYGGHWIVSARETKKPSVRNKRGELVTEDAKIAETLDKRYADFLSRVEQLDRQDVFQSFFNAYAMAIEPHTNYLGPRASENFQISMRLSLEGIGAVLQREGEYVVIRSVVEGGPHTGGLRRVTASVSA